MPVARKSSVTRAVSGQAEYGAPLGIHVAEEDRPTPFRPLALRQAAHDSHALFQFNEHNGVGHLFLIARRRHMNGGPGADTASTPERGLSLPVASASGAMVPR